MKKSTLLAKRALIIQRIALQRAAVAKLATAFRKPLAVLDMAVVVEQQIKLHPYYFIGSAALLAVVFRKHMHAVRIGFTGIAWLLSAKSLRQEKKPSER